ncbi:hypothetical protein F4804DRAFT_349752 [Jackrogersella minutella]|nr:hypothetical protein F4804DRAFT_349752 [Jackrogersella minutella]
MPAQEKFFEKTELVDMMLEKVDTHDLLVNVPLVCKKWNELTKKQYTKTQKALSFLFDPMDQESRTRGMEYVQTPILSRYIGPFFGKPPGESIRPIAIEIIDGLHPNQPWDERLLGWGDAPASWRDMQLAQPPITKIFWVSIVPDTFEAVAELSFPKGLRMGQLYDLLRYSTNLESTRILWPGHWRPKIPKFKLSKLHQTVFHPQRRFKFTTDNAGGLVIKHHANDDVYQVMMRGTETRIKPDHWLFKYGIHLAQLQMRITREEFGEDGTNWIPAGGTKEGGKCDKEAMRYFLTITQP